LSSHEAISAAAAGAHIWEWMTNPRASSSEPAWIIKSQYGVLMASTSNR